MARNREERYQDARSLEVALEEIQAASGKKMTSAGLTQLVAGVSTTRKRPSRAPKPPPQSLPIPDAPPVARPPGTPSIPPTATADLVRDSGDDQAASEPGAHQATDPGPPFFGPTPAPSAPPLPPPTSVATPPVPRREDTTEKLTLAEIGRPGKPKEPDKAFPEEPTIVVAPPREAPPATVAEPHTTREELTQEVSALPWADQPRWKAVAVAFAIGGCLAAAVLAFWLARR